MRSSTSATCRSRITTRIAPSPSTRARKSVLIVRRPLSAMPVACGAEGLLGRVEGVEGAAQVPPVRAQLLPFPGQGHGVRALHRAEAAVAAAVVGGAERAAARVGDRAET